MEVAKAALLLNRLSSGDKRLVVQVYNPCSVGGTPSSDVDYIGAGMDWDAGKVIITPKDKLTRLTQEEVAAVMKSAKEGQSWHAYQQYKKQDAIIKDLEAQIVALKSQLK